MNAVFCLLHLIGMDVYFKLYVSKEVPMDTMEALGIFYGEIAKSGVKVNVNFTQHLNLMEKIQDENVIFIQSLLFIKSAL